jgi:hypothetical protein
MDQTFAACSVHLSNNRSIFTPPTSASLDPLRSPDSRPLTPRPIFCIIQGTCSLQFFIAGRLSFLAVAHPFPPIAHIYPKVIRPQPPSEYKATQRECPLWSL